MGAVQMKKLRLGEKVLQLSYGQYSFLEHLPCAGNINMHLKDYTLGILKLDKRNRCVCKYSNLCPASLAQYEKKNLIFLSLFKSELLAENLVLLLGFLSQDMSKDLKLAVLLRVVAGNSMLKLGQVNRI